METVLPGTTMKNVVRGKTRQKFAQAASSLSEALLRAATGAGVNEHEARQKVEELTPVYGDLPEVREQKRAAIPMYLKSLEARAGRAFQGGAAPGGGSAATKVNPTNGKTYYLHPDGKYYLEPPR